MEDIQLLRLLQKDPNAGMEQLMNQYTGLVYAVVKSRLADTSCISSEIEDCVADVFSNFYIELAKFDSARCSIRSYLCVIARNRAIDIAKRKHNRHGHISLDDEQAILQIGENLELETHLAEAQLRKEVLTAVKKLGEPDSSILFRKFYLGQTSAQIADALQLSTSNVDTRTHRALNKLRNLFGGHKA